MTNSATSAVAEYAASTTAVQLPPPVRVRTQQIILDELASAVFGRVCAAGALAASYARQMTGPPEASILGTSESASAPYAAFANGMAGHADEIDGTHIAGGHPGATLVHAALAVAERQGASGAELVNAVALGYDIAVRLVLACGGIYGIRSRYHLHSDFLCAVGAAVACGRLLRLDEGQLRHAMALATFQANGLCALFRERDHISKAMCNGQYAFAGVSASLMAFSGMEGSNDILGEEHGLLEAWGVDSAWETVTKDLGSDFAVMGANFKFMRAGYPIHAAVEAALGLLAGGPIDVSSISSVNVGMPEEAMRVVDNRAMHNICLQDVLSAALLLGGLPLQDSCFPAILEDPRFRDLRMRIELNVDLELEASQPLGRGASVTITTNDGSTFSATVQSPRGNALRGEVDWADLSEKWRRALPSYDVDRMVGVAQDLQDLGRLSELARAFQPRSHSRL